MQLFADPTDFAALNLGLDEDVGTYSKKAESKLD